MIPLIAGVTFFCNPPAANARQEFKEHISKEFTLQKQAAATTVAIYNLNGPVKVEGYAGDKIVIDIDKTIKAHDDANLETGKKELKVEFEQTGDSIIAWLAEPYDARPHQDRHNYDHYREIEYNFNLSFIVKVPYNVNLLAATIQNGSVDVKQVAGTLCVSNINGGVTISDAKGTTKATTINGSIVINYSSNPPGQSSYHTINGDIRLNYQPGLSADMEFKSMHGEFYTDFDATLLPLAPTKNIEKTGEGTAYKLNKTTTVRFGSGGSLYKLETLNGNVYIKKQS